MEIARPAPMGPIAALAAEMPLRKVPEVRQVDPGKGMGESAADARGTPRQAENAAAARDIDAFRREMERREKPAGPPPTFEVSLLEVNQDFRRVMARIEAARAQARDADALRAEARAEMRDAEADRRASEAEIAATEAETPAGGAMGSDLTGDAMARPAGTPGDARAPSAG